MKRLSDEIDGEDPEFAQLGRLMQAVGPLPPSELRQRRVLQAMRSRAAAGPSARPLLRMAMASGLLVIIGGVAGATVGRSAWQRMVSLLAPASSSAGEGARARSLPASPAATPAAPVADPIAAPAVVAPALPPPPALGAHPLPVAAHHERAATSGRSASGSAAPGGAAAGPSPASIEDTRTEALMSAALSALRGSPAERDPERARVLLEDYLGAYPNGRFAEAALAYDIEAASAQSRDEARALARTYLARYPNGDYVETARRAIAAR